MTKSQRTGSADERRERAEALLAEHLGRAGSLDGFDLESLCAAQPELADALRATWRDCQQVGDLLEALASASLPAAERSPAPASASDSDPATSALVRRLAESRPARSRYAVTGEVGRGGMGAVFEVWDEDLQRRLAMKVALGDGSAADSSPQTPLEAKRLGRFLDEAQITGQLEHPGVVPVHELGLDPEGRVYFTMPLVRGSDLRAAFRRVREGKEGWTVTRALHVLARVCETLAYAHHRGVVHRDLKPANVMVGNFGEAYVMDWGLARVAGRPDQRDIRLPETADPGSLRTLRRSLAEDSPDSPLVTNDGDVIGTPSYMPPEQARGEVDEVDQRADVYAVGAMIYELFAGRAPYQPPGRKLSARTILIALLEAPPRRLSEIAPDLPAELEAIVEKAMARDKHERYESVLALSHDLRAYLEDRVVRAYEAGPVAELRKWVRRNRATAAALAALVLLAIGASLLVAWREAEKQQDLRTAYGELEREQDARLALADVMATQVLIGESNAFGPDQAGIDGMARWIERVEQVLSRRQSAAAKQTELSEPERGVHVGRLDQLAELLPRQRERLAHNREVRELTLEAHAETWARCRAQIAAAAVYGGLDVPPQLGLVPLRANPESELWEFWHVPSGEQPPYDEGSGWYDLSPECGLVLVLIPGGQYQMGSPFDAPEHEADETQHEEQVAPFFLSKYEVTQAQWVRALGSNPSFQKVGSRLAERVTDALYPVETISWYEATTFARLTHLRLPSEPEWEYAARAGSDAEYSFGPDPDELWERENVADQSHAQSYWHPTSRELARAAAWDDGFPGTAPVGSFEPTAFGLFDIHGNVGEWTSSSYLGDYGATPPPAPPVFGHTEERVARGGNAMFGPHFARLPSRQPVPPKNASRIVGLRPARDLER